MYDPVRIWLFLVIEMGAVRQLINYLPIGTVSTLNSLALSTVRTQIKG